MANVVEFKVTPQGEAIKRAYEQLGNLHLNVGFQQGEAEGDGTSIADIAAWNDRGTFAPDGSVNIPARPFMENSWQHHEDELNALVSQSLTAMGNAQQDSQTSLNQIGAAAVGIIQEEMVNGAYDANAPITIEGGWMRSKYSGKPFHVEPKGSARPLVDTGTMRQSVTFAIKEGDDG